MAVDPAGNVILAGTFRDTTKFDTNTISGNGEDVFIAKLGNNTIPLHPVIQTQPQNQSVSPGTMATFGVVASGAPPLQFQWRFNGTNIAGGTNALLTITNSLLANAGSYDVVVSNAAGSTNSVVATLTVVPGTPNFADDFTGRGILIGFTNYVTGNNSTYTRESGELDHAERKGTHSAWLTWTAPDNGSCVMDTLDSSFDTVLAVYTGAVVSNLTLVTANDDVTPGILQSRVAFNAVAGVAYQIAVDGYAAADAGNVVFHLSFSNAAPIITVQPQGHSVVTGSNTTFSVAALGIPPLNFQWRFNGLDIVGATNANHTINNVQPANEGAYAVVVGNSFGSVTSAVATLTVLQRPAINALSFGQIVAAGDAVTFEVGAAGTSPLSYQWRFNGTDIAGAFAPTFTINNAQPAQAGAYTVVVSNPYGAVTSAVMTLTVNFSLTMNTNGNGSVSRAPDLSTYPPNSVVNVTAAPGPGAFLVNWSGDASGTNNPLAVTMTSNKVITANFAATSLTLAMEGPGNIAKAPDRPFYSIGEQVTLTAIAGRWHAFAGWGDGPLINPRIITIGTSNIYTAIFSPTTAVETLTFSNVSRTAPVGMPAILIDGHFVVTGSVSRLDSARVELLTTFPNGTIIYTLDGSEPTLFSSLYFEPFVLRRTITVRAVAWDANFVNSWETDPVRVIIEPRYVLNASTVGGGRIAVSPTNASHLSNTVVRFGAIPDPGWEFLQWLGDVRGTNLQSNVTMTRDKCMEAVFGTGLSTTTVGVGTVLVQPSAALYPFGTPVRLTAVPESGNAFALWGNAGSGTNNPLNFTITNANRTVSAAFAPLSAGQFSLTVLADGFGMVTNRARGNRFTSGTSITLTAVPEAGQQFIGWSGDAGGALNPLTVTLNASKVITAQFTRRPSLMMQPCSEPSLEDGFQFLITGEFGARYEVERNDGWQGWAPLASVTNLFGVTQFNDVTTTNPTLQRVYRAVLAP